MASPTAADFSLPTAKFLCTMCLTATGAGSAGAMLEQAPRSTSGNTSNGLHCIRRPLRIALFLLFLAIHGEHALGDEETAEDIHAGEDEREEAEELGCPGGAPDGCNRHGDQRADDDDRRDGIGDAHQRR